MLTFVPNQIFDSKMYGDDIKKHENTPQAVVTPHNIWVYEHFRKSKSFLFNHSKTVTDRVCLETKGQRN